MSYFTAANATQFYQRNESKFILVVVILLSAYLLSFAAKITWTIIAEPAEQTVQPNVENPKLSGASETSSSINIAKIIDQNLFGNANAPKPVAPVQEVTEVPQTQLNLVLSGVVSSNDPNRGAAIIEYRNNQDTYGVGDKIEGTSVTLDEIYADRVIIKNRVTRETLMLDGIDFDEANKKRAQDSQMSSSNISRAIAPSNTVVMNQNMRETTQAFREARKKITQEPASFTDMISVLPHRIDGVFVGFQVSPGAQPGLFNALGLKNGDVIVQLNGLDLSDLQQSTEAMTQLQEADSLQLEVLRSGEFVSLELDIPAESGNE